MNEKLSDRIIVAIDKAKLEDAELLLKQLEGVITYYKIGFEFFTAYGWEAVKLVKRYGGRVFLDLKLHDIPNTVKKTIQVICEHEVDIVNVHALGGLQMMSEVGQVLEAWRQDHDHCPKVIGVTVLTSHTEEALKQDLGISRRLDEQVLHLAGLVQEGGLDGVVCSPREIRMLRKSFSEEFLIVTPGIRPAGAALGDQKRVMTPPEAFQAGASYIVIGRPITEAEDPRSAAESIVNSLET